MAALVVVADGKAACVLFVAVGVEPFFTHRCGGGEDCGWDVMAEGGDGQMRWAVKSGGCGAEKSRDERRSGDSTRFQVSSCSERQIRRFACPSPLPSPLMASCSVVSLVWQTAAVGCRRWRSE